MSDKCVCCGKVIPESRQVCSWCESNVTIEKQVFSEMSKGELTKEVMRLTNEMIRVEEQQNKIYNMFLNLLGRVAKSQ